jgi:hypothetical protein
MAGWGTMLLKTPAKREGGVGRTKTFLFWEKTEWFFYAKSQIVDVTAAVRGSRF